MTSGIIVLNTADSTLRLSATDGSVDSMLIMDKEINLHSGQLFTIGLRDRNADLHIFSSKDFSCGKKVVAPRHIVFNYFDHSECGTLEVSIEIRSDASSFRFRPTIKNVPSDFKLEWIDTPQITVPGGGQIFWPHAEGVLIDHPELREISPWSRYHVLGFLGLNDEEAYSEGGYYPGMCQMQFLSWQKNGVCIYFGAHDSEHGTKAVEYVPENNGDCRFSLQTFCGDTVDYIPSFDYVLKGMPGDWMDACSSYRDWIRHDTALPAKGMLPEMVDRSPVVVIHPVRGIGDDKGKMNCGNEYFPYENAMPYIRKYSELFDSCILSLLMHWEGTAPWAPPYVWPPFGGQDMLADYGKQLHAEGHYLGVYCSGSAWTQKSCIVDYSRERECEEQNLYRHMIKGPHGDINAVICNGDNSQRIGFDMCIAEEWTRRTLKEELLKLTEADIDYAQFFDQNLGGAFHTCYATTHRHPPVPGKWQTIAMKSLLEEMTADLKQKNSEMILGCEAAAADSYLKNLPFSDLRSCWNWSRGMPVPGYQFVFHEYVNNFMGNQCGISDVFDCQKSPENLLYRIAYAFNAGDLLSIVLKDAGRIHWGWGALWSMKEPEQEHVVTLIRNLNMHRKRNKEFLAYGRMEKPWTRIKGESFALHLRDKKILIDSFLHSAWTSPKMERGEIITNFCPGTQTVVLDFPANCLAYIDGCEVHSGTQLVLKPLDAICVILAEKKEDHRDKY